MLHNAGGKSMLSALTPFIEGVWSGGTVCEWRMEERYSCESDTE